MALDVFSGRILGVGTTSGVRLVVGDWAQSPLGQFTDVFVAHADGRRELIAPTQQVADYVAATYSFDDVRVSDVTTTEVDRRFSVWAGPLQLTATFGARTATGWLLRAVPSKLATSPKFSEFVAPVAKVVMPGVRTHGSAGQGRYEWYGARDIRRVASLEASWSGEDLGELADVHPAPQFGFSSTPRTPSLTSVTTTVRRD